jgi:hypothetical protein
VIECRITDAINDARLTTSVRAKDKRGVDLISDAQPRLEVLMRPFSSSFRGLMFLELDETGN